MFQAFSLFQGSSGTTHSPEIRYKRKKHGTIRDFVTRVEVLEGISAEMAHKVTHGGCLCVFPGLDARNPCIVLISRQRHPDCYTIPKGHIDPGEDAVTAAVRETMEEAGVYGEVGRELGVYVDDNQKSTIHGYVLLLNRMDADWHESKQRKRVVVPLQDVVSGKVKVSTPTLAMCQTYIAELRK
jgi:ADP-ribose pyrophosphatase YjhB (NUDIX family)